jgi:hypothetical protein
VDILVRERGYYARLLEPSVAARESVTSGESARAIAPWMFQNVQDSRERVLRPNLDVVIGGARFRTNASGLRDPERTLRKPPNTARIVVAGDSVAAGWGVTDDECFVRLLEVTPSVNHTPHSPSRVEFINCAAPGYAPGQRFEHLRIEGFRFDPDLMLFESTPADFGWDEKRLRRLLPRGRAFDAFTYRVFLERYAITRATPVPAIAQVLHEHRAELLGEAYAAAAAECRKRGVRSVWVLLPRLGRNVDERTRRVILELAARAGFDRVVDLTSLWEGIDPRRFAVATGDYHPNAMGHHRIAETLRPILESELAHTRASKLAIASARGESHR